MRLIYAVCDKYFHKLFLYLFLSVLMTDKNFDDQVYKSARENIDLFGTHSRPMPSTELIIPL